MYAILVYVFIFFLGGISYVAMRRGKKEVYNGVKLPPGSMGWPYIGETLQLYSQDPNVFFTEKQKRSLFLLCTFDSFMIIYCFCMMRLNALYGETDMEKSSRPIFSVALVSCWLAQKHLGSC